MKTGDKLYFTGYFEPRVPVVFMRRRKNGMADVRVTATRGSFKRGEILDYVFPQDLIPRKTRQ